MTWPPLSAGAWQPSIATVLYFFNDEDDIKSLRRFLARYLSPETMGGGDPTAGNPWLYYNPVPEGQFQRPAVTMRIIDTAPDRPAERRAANASWQVTHTIAINCYGVDRASTMSLAEKVFVLLEGGAPDRPPWRIPMWNFAVGVRLAREMRVLPRSVQMGLEDTDDQNKWVRPIRAQLSAPRTRPVSAFPIITQISDRILGQ